MFLLHPLHSAGFRSSLRRLRHTVFGALLTTACSSSDLVLPREGPPAGSGIKVVAGDEQRGEVGEVLNRPIRVEVTDATGDPMPGAAVIFEVTSAGEGAEIFPSPATTDEDGFAEAQMRLGDKAGVQTGVARLLVDGDPGPTATFSAFANPAGDPDNREPDADYNWHCETLICQFTDASSDPDGDVVRWQWDFGDGSTSDQAEPLHVYPGPGTYEVTLVVTDEDGATDASTAHVEVELD